MWTTLAFVAALSAAPAQQPGQLSLSNARATYGVLGPTRPNNKILPGEAFHIAFDILNLQAGADGEVQYSMGMEVVNPMGQTEFKRDAPMEPVKLFNVLGGNTIPAFAHATTDVVSPPGKYTLKVTVVDGRTKKSQTISQAFEVLNKDFGIVDLGMTYDPPGNLPAPAGGVAGQTIFLNFWALGFKSNASGKDMIAPKLALSMRILDEQGKPTTQQPVTGEFKDPVPANTPKIPLSFPLALNRAGKFTVELTATDQNANKMSKVTFPLIVTAQK